MAMAMMMTTMLIVIMTMAKVVLSVYAGVAQQKAMQGDSPGGRVSFIAQVTAQQVCGIPAILLALPLCSQVRGAKRSQQKQPEHHER